MKTLMTLKTASTNASILNGKVFYLESGPFNRVKFVDAQTGYILKTSRIVDSAKFGNTIILKSLSSNRYELVTVCSIVPTANDVTAIDLILDLANAVLHNI